MRRIVRVFRTKIYGFTLVLVVIFDVGVGGDEESSSEMFTKYDYSIRVSMAKIGEIGKF